MRLSFIILIFLLQHKSIMADSISTPVSGEECGRPGYSKMSTYTPQKQQYANGKFEFFRSGESVEYACENSDMILIGPSKRTCSNGQWSKRKIPKCATKIPKSEASYIAGNVLVISSSLPSRIAAVTITLYARKTNLNIAKVKFLPEYTCNKTFGPEQDSAFLPYSINFVCKSNLVRRSQYREGNFVIIFFSGEISCDVDCSYKIKKDDNVDLYEIDEDDCLKPDSPLYGLSRTWPIRDRAPNSRSMNRTITHLSNSTANNTTLSLNLTQGTNSNITISPPQPATTFDTSTSTYVSTVASTVHRIDISTTTTITSSNITTEKTLTENSTIISSTEPSNVQLEKLIVSTNKIITGESNKQKYFCEENFRMTIEESDNFDEIMAESRSNVKQFEQCEKGEDWIYVRLPECIPLKFCTPPIVSDNVIPTYAYLYLNEYAVINDVVTYRCLQESDVNIGGSSQTCMLNGNWSGLKPRCVTKNSGLSSNNAIIYLSVSVSVISLIILVVAIYCAFRLNETASKAVQVFNEQLQQTLTTQSSLNSGTYIQETGSYASNQSLIYGQQQSIARQLPKIPSLYTRTDHIYDSVQNVVIQSTNEPRYVDFQTYQSKNQTTKRQQPSTWGTLKLKLKKQNQIDDTSSSSYRRQYSSEYDYIDLKTNDYKRIIEMNNRLPDIVDEDMDKNAASKKQISTFKQDAKTDITTNC